MAKLFLRGVAKPIVIEKSTAVTLNRIKDDNTIPKDHEFNRNGLRFSKGDIRYIFENDQEDDKAESDIKRIQENDTYYTNIQNDYTEYIKTRCRMTPEEKAKDFRMFDTLFLGVTGKKLNEEQIKYIQKVQLDYFKENKNHPYANINFYKLIKELPDNKDDFNMKYHIASATLRIVSKLIEESFITAKQLNLMA